MENVQQNEDSPSLTKFYDELVYKGEEVLEANVFAAFPTFPPLCTAMTTPPFGHKKAVSTKYRLIFYPYFECLFSIGAGVNDFASFGVAYIFSKYIVPLFFFLFGHILTSFRI